MKYWIATDKTEIFHWGSFDENEQELTTTQPYLMWFDGELEQQAELDALGVQWRMEERDNEDSLQVEEK